MFGEKCEIHDSLSPTNDTVHRTAVRPVKVKDYVDKPGDSAPNTGVGDRAALIVVSPPGIPLEDDDASLLEDDASFDKDKSLLEDDASDSESTSSINDGSEPYNSGEDKLRESDDNEIMSDAKSNTGRAF